jgi:hypothetical protein
VGADAHNLVLDLLAEASNDGQRQQQGRHADRDTADRDDGNEPKETLSLTTPFSAPEVSQSYESFEHSAHVGRAVGKDGMDGTERG